MAEAGARPWARSDEKHRAIVRAAREVFLSNGYLGTNMDLIASRSGVSKQTVYTHFGSKEALFVEIVGSMTGTAGDRVHHDRPELGDDADLEAYLRAFAERQLRIVTEPELLQLRRLVIGEVGRFPELAKVLYERGPQRAIAELTAMFEPLRARELLAGDPAAMAEWFNWLVMAAPLNRAMMLGDSAVPADDDLRRHVAEAVRIFLTAFAP
ncbi:TetR/AcrR family transcriptional regulator [Jiangella alkaliphila]|uniref:DNA-binding transcriptional regulator, AcrR family n=1 Tax=Jiangella alkaliphila TaxID=419479 RepID=A0A1H2LA53_9ACTN|nr:TetR/AcrR family transcriptional regulator [Jiangella alkaliphila]SDU77789.1 DNA-binding transcriptional regulator, AcrR family [Jiangella alkaliphila]